VEKEYHVFVYARIHSVEDCLNKEFEMGYELFKIIRSSDDEYVIVTKKISLPAFNLKVL
jgi:hypothetical protein